MVEIIERTKKERALETKVKNLIRITSKLIDKDKINPSENLPCFNITNDISVFCDINLIRVDKEKDYDAAFKLAEAYEKETGEKWKLKPYYN